MKPDVVLTWPRHADYPIFRAWLERERGHLGYVSVAFTEHHVGRDYRPYLRHELLLRVPGVHLVDAPREDGRDWRDTAVNLALDRVHGDWVLFMEQDFIVTDDRAFREAIVRTTCSGSHVVGAGYVDRGDGDRLHPSCLLVRRDVVEQTSRYFGPEPVDHFHAFGREVQEHGLVDDLLSRLDQAPEFGHTGHFAHVGGLTQNHNLSDAGHMEQVRRPCEHARYLDACLRERHHPEWEEDALDFLRWAVNYGGAEIGVDPGESRSAPAETGIRFPAAPWNIDERPDGSLHVV